MIILPAIDIKSGQCVRLTQGDFSTTEKVAEDPLETAFAFEKAGAEWIHMVDLDGALEGETVNKRIFLDVAGKTGLKVEVGGGIRSMDAVAFYVEGGVQRVILGSVAISQPEIVGETVREYGGRIAVGIDARNEMVSGSGWTEDSNIHYIELAKRMEDMGVRTIIYTDISRDGTLQGPNLEQLARINDAVSCDIVASGGIRAMEDIKALSSMELCGAICGKSIYKGTLSLGEAIRYCRLAC